jgi:chaperone required for assembly of F1-ATPase
MKRWYQYVDVIFKEGGWHIVLDGKPARTPLKNPFIIPSHKLAEAIAAEWDAQGERFDKTTMPLSAYASVAIDIVPAQRPFLIDEMLAYAQTDLLCYRAEDEKLAQKQAELFDPLVNKLADTYGIKLNVTKGIMPVAQPLENQAIIREYVKALGDFHFAGLMIGMQALSSLFLAILLKDEYLDAAGTLQASRFDERMQAETWGITETYVQKQEQIQSEVFSISQFFVCLQETTCQDEK